MKFPRRRYTLAKCAFLHLAPFWYYLKERQFGTLVAIFLLTFLMLSDPSAREPQELLDLQMAKSASTGINENNRTAILSRDSASVLEDNIETILSSSKKHRLLEVPCPSDTARVQRMMHRGRRWMRYSCIARSPERALSVRRMLSGATVSFARYFDRDTDFSDADVVLIWEIEELPRRYLVALLNAVHLTARGKAAIGSYRLGLKRGFDLEMPPFLFPPPEKRFGDIDARSPDKELLVYSTARLYNRFAR